MANTYKNIIITPNIGNTADPKIQLLGGNTTANTDINLFVYPSSNGTVSFEGSAGQLFSITNDLSNSLFAVSDVSGIPSLEVFANGLVSAIPFGGNVVFGNSTASVLVNSTAFVGNIVGVHTGNVVATTITGNLTGNTAGIHTGAVVLGTSSLSANGGLGTAGHVLHSNGTATYWAADDNAGGTVTSVASGNGITGGTITSTGTLSAVAGTGTVVNATGIHVNATYIATISANNASFLGGVAAASYVQNTESRTLSGNLNFTGSNTTVNAVFRVVNATANVLFAGANGNIGIGTNSPVVSLDVRGVLQSQAYDMPNTDGTAQWVKLGTFTAGQTGHSIRIRLNLHTGYNAANSQDFYVDIFFKTSNGSSLDGNGFAGNSFYATRGFRVQDITPKWVSSAAGAAAASYDLYLYLPAYTLKSHYLVEISQGTTWTNLGTLSQTDPGVGSSTVLLSSAGYNITVGNVGIGNTTPAHRLRVEGTTSLAGAVSGITTLAAGNTTITGFVNASSITTTGLVTLGTGSTYLKRVITTLDQGVNNTTYEIARISRDSANWSNQFLEITAFNHYYRSGKTKWNITYNQVDAGTITCEHASGTIMHKVYLGAEVLVSGTIYYRPVLIDLPQYTRATIEVNYWYGEVASITNSSQIYFTGTYVTNASASASYSGDIHLNPNGGNTGIGNTSPAHKLRVTGTTSLAGAVSDITTLAAGNTTITGFVNATSSLAVSTAFTANATVVNAVSYYSGTLLVANTTVINATHLAGYTFAAPPVIGSGTANGASLTYANVSGQVNTATLYATTSANIASAVQANATGLWTTGTVNAAVVSSTNATFTRVTNVVQAVGDLRANLGLPSIEENALFHGQMNNKFRFIAPTSQEQSADGVTWTTSTRATAAELGDLMIGEGQGTGFNAIPSGTIGTADYYRLTWNVYATTGYIYLNHLYIFASTQGNQVNFKIEALNNVTSLWETFASGTSSGWPSHFTLKHSTIPYYNLVSAGLYAQVRVTFTVASRTNTNSVILYAMEWFGGYPNGRRNVESYDRFKNVTFPANVVAGTFSGNLVSRNINGTAFNGSADITTANWGTARNINGTSVNGSANYAIGRIYDTNYRRFTNPGGGEYVTATATITGAIQIVFPNVFSFGMYKMTIEVYEYVTNQSFTVVAAGHTSGTLWYNTSAYIIGNPSIDRRYTVRFGRNAANKAVVYIGELASTWSYPQVFLTEFQCGYAGFEDNSTGWAISFNTTAFENVSQSITNSQVGYAVSTNTVNSTVLRDGSGNFSAGTITASLSGSTSGTHTGAVVLGASSLSANGGVGTAGQVLHSNGSATYWAADDNAGGTVTSVASGNGITGGTITSTGTLSAVAGTGTVVNATGIHVNATYIATLNANNAYYINGNTVVSVMESLRANRNITGGGTITVDSAYNVLWSARFIIISNGRGAHFSTAGYFDIQCPTSGTITGVGGSANKTATAAGIPLGAWESLYYILPIGSDQTSLAANFRVSSYTVDVEIPSNWVLICARNADGAFAVSFPNGINLLPTQSYNTTIFSSSIVPAANTSTLLNGKTEGNLNVNSAVSASQIDGVDFHNGNGTLNGIAGPNNLTNNGITYVNGVSLFSQTDGALYSQAYSVDWVHQIYGDYRSGQIAVRGKNSGTWQAWRTILDSTNYTSYSPSLTGSGASGTWGISVTGTAYGKTEGNLNVNAAAQLVTTRSINGVNFNGTANILVPSIYDSNYRRIDNPGGAEYITTSSPVTGAIQITLPVGWTNTMMRMTIRIYEYASDSSFDVVCGGYNYNPTTTWVNTFAYILGDKDVDRRYTVRFGFTAGGKCVIYIGELASTWSYPQVFVTDVQLGYGGQSATWVSGWAIGVQATAFEAVTSTVTSTQIGFGTSTSTAGALVLRDASSNFAANNISTGNTTVNATYGQFGVSVQESATINATYDTTAYMSDSTIGTTSIQPTSVVLTSTGAAPNTGSFWPGGLSIGNSSIVAYMQPGTLSITSGSYNANLAATTLTMSIGGSITTVNATVVNTTTVNATSYTVGTAFTANATVVNAVSYYAGTLLVANTTVINATHLAGVATSGYARRGGGLGNIDYNAERARASGFYSVDASPTNGPPAATYSNYIQMYERSDTGAQIVVDYANGQLHSRGIYLGGTPSYSAWRTYLSNTANLNISGGFTVTAYNANSAGSPNPYTPSGLNGNYQYITNNSGFTLAAPTADCAIDLLIINGGTPGAVGFSGFQTGVTGGSLNQTPSHEFIVSIRRIAGYSTYSIYALQ